MLGSTGVNLFMSCSLLDISVFLWTFIVLHDDKCCQCINLDLVQHSGSPVKIVQRILMMQFYMGRDLMWEGLYVVWRILVMQFYTDRDTTEALYIVRRILTMQFYTGRDTMEVLYIVWRILMNICSSVYCDTAEALYIVWRILTNLCSSIQTEKLLKPYRYIVEKY